VDEAGPPGGARLNGAPTADLRDSLQKIVDEVNRGLAVYERIQKFVIVREGFSTENEREPHAETPADPKRDGL